MLSLKGIPQSEQMNVLQVALGHQADLFKESGATNNEKPYRDLQRLANRVDSVEAFFRRLDKLIDSTPKT